MWRNRERRPRSFQRSVVQRNIFFSEKIVKKYEASSAFTQERQDLIENKKGQLEDLKRALPEIRGQIPNRIESSEGGADILKNMTKYDAASFEQIAYMEKIICHMTEENKQFYEHQMQLVDEDLQRFLKDMECEQRARLETLHFWLSMYKDMAGKVDPLLRKMFDDLKSKQRDIAILKKYRKLNQKKIELVEAAISEKEAIIEEDRQKKQDIKDKRERELMLIAKATKVQAWWRGVMVRRKLGPYGPKKDQKGKGKKGKSKKGKSKKGKSKIGKSKVKKK